MAEALFRFEKAVSLLCETLLEISADGFDEVEAVNLLGLKLQQKL